MNVNWPEHTRVLRATQAGEDPHKWVLTASEEQALDDAFREDDNAMVDALLGLTACPEECEVAADGQCEHGYLSLGQRANLLED